MKTVLISLFLLSSILSSIALGIDPQEQLNASILTEFDHETIIDVEGYWASSSNLQKDTYHGKYPFPKAHAQPWPGKAEFLDKLKRIEQLDENGQCVIRGLERLVMRGMAPSRFEQVSVGNEEFRYHGKDRTISWTDAFGRYYVERFNVKPSREFYNFVMSFDVEKELIDTKNFDVVVKNIATMKNQNPILVALKMENPESRKWLMENPDALGWLKRYLNYNPHEEHELIYLQRRAHFDGDFAFEKFLQKVTMYAIGGPGQIEGYIRSRCRRLY